MRSVVSAYVRLGLTQVIRLNSLCFRSVMSLFQFWRDHTGVTIVADQLLLAGGERHFSGVGLLLEEVKSHLVISGLPDVSREWGCIGVVEAPGSSTGSLDR